jgi:hypothetical protein
MAATESSLEAALDTIWTRRRFVEQLFEENMLLDKLKKTDKYTQGKEAKVPLHVSRNGGFTSLPSGGGNLNEAGNQGYDEATFKLTHHHQQVALQGDILDIAGDGDEASIVDAADEEITRALNDMERQFTRMSYADGSGLIAQCRTSDSNNVDLNTVSGRQAIERGYLFEGLPIDVGTKEAETAIVDGSKITAVDEEKWAVTVAAGNIAGEGTTHFVSVKNGRSGTTSREMNGLRSIYSATAEIGGLSPAVQRQWKALVDSTTTELSIAALLNAKRRAKGKSRKKANFLVASELQQQRLYELIQTQVQFAGDKGLEAGNDEMTKWNGMTIFADPDCPEEDLYIGHLEHLFMVHLKNGGGPYWQNRHTGGKKLDWIQGTDSYGGKLTWRANLACDRRNDGFRFSALATA